MSQSRQGVSRKLTPQAILILAISVRLARELAIPLKLALVLAARLAEQGGTNARATVAGLVTLEMNVSAVIRDTDERLAHAVEVTPTPQRGRPRLKHAGP